MKTLKGLSAQLVVCALLLLPATARAADPVWEGAATAVTMLLFSIAPYDDTLIYTTNSSSGCDPVLHVWDADSGTEVAFNDDLFGPNPLVYVENNTGSTRLYFVVLRSADNSSQGTTRLIKDGVTWVTSAAVGGTSVTVNGGSNYVYETAFAPGAIENSALFALSSSGNLIDYDLDGGVGKSSSVTASSAATVVVSYNPFGGVAGDVRLYTNDRNYNDSDGDGLGDALEYFLGTCDDWWDPGCGDVHEEEDSDRDGLPDAAEVFGVDVSGPELFLPRWGADPTTKDMFVEVDFVDASYPGGNPMAALGTAGLEAWYDQLEDIFDDGTAADIGNLSSETGVRLHIDLGVEPASSSYETSYGDWGGGGDATDTSNRYNARDDFMQDAREGVFRYALAWPDGGQAGGTVFDWSPGSTGNPLTFAHELGHTAGLQHWGSTEFDGGTRNCKPTYRSLMNYGYYGWPTLSTENSGPVLNSANLLERFVFPVGYNASQLDGDSRVAWDVDVIDSGRSVDWNDDGVMDTSATRWPATFTWNSCDALLEEALADELEIDSPGTRAGTPEIALWDDDWLLLFYTSADGVIRYYSGELGSMADASCPLGNDYDSDCFDWEGPYTVGAYSGVQAVSVEWWKGGLALAYWRTNNYVYAKRITGITSSGQLTGISTSRYLGTSDVAPELVTLNVDSAVHGHDEELAVFLNSTSTTSYRYRTTTSASVASSGVWGSTLNVQDTTGSTLTGSFSPALVAWPSIEPPSSFDGVATTCGVFPTTAGALDFYCLDPASTSLRWQALSSSAHAEFGTPTASDDPDIMFRHDRLPSGAPTSSTTIPGTFWLSFPTSGGYTDTYISDRVSLNAPPNNGNWEFLLRGKTSSNWSVPISGTGPRFFDSLHLGAPKGAWVIERDNGTVENLEFYKAADGTVDHDFETGNDFRVLEVTICRWLHGDDGDTYCGDETESAWGY